MEKIFEQFSGFQWDIGNIDKNLTKHNVENWECEQVFFNKPLLVHADESHSTQIEKRFYILGQTDIKRKLFIVFTVRDDLIRIISGRDMSRKERKAYEEARKTDTTI